MAYSGWKKENTDKWERTRALSFYTIAPHANGKFKTWQEVFPIPGEKVKKSKKTFIRIMNEDEKKEAKELGVKFNG